MFALFSFLLFRRSGYNYAEHLVLNTYITSQQLLLFIGWLLLTRALPVPAEGMLGLYVALTLGYNLWVYVQFCGARTAAGFMRAFVAMGLGYLGQLLLNLLFFRFGACTCKIAPSLLFHSLRKLRMKDPFPFYSIGHFINQPANPTQFEITRFEEMDEPDVEDPHKHTFYEIIWIEEGVSKQVIDYREFVIQPGTLFFISPGQVHHFEEWQGVKGGSVFFTESFFLLNQQNKDKLFELSFLDNFYANPFLMPGAAGYAELKGTIDWLLKENAAPTPLLIILQSLLHVLLAQVQRLFDGQAPAAVSRKHFVIFKKFKGLLEAHFAAGLMAGEYAEKLHVTAHHLNHVVKLVTGRTASEVIRARTVLEAKRLLTFTDQNVSEVAAGLGLFDASYFARIFKAETGVSPIEFKKAISEKYRIR